MVNPMIAKRFMGLSQCLNQVSRRLTDYDGNPQVDYKVTQPRSYAMLKPIDMPSLLTKGSAITPMSASSTTIKTKATTK